MHKSQVYFCDMRTAAGGMSLPQKLANLIKRANIAKIDMKNKFVAIKMHFGEPEILLIFVRNFPKPLPTLSKELGGRPFLTDCNTMYTGLRHNALDHLYAAEIDGFNSATTGCYVIIGDGLKGDDEVTVDINGELVQKAYIGRAMRDADVIVTLSHFKGHEMAGFGGCLKNLGMGGASIAGKKTNTREAVLKYKRTDALDAEFALLNALTRR